MLQPDERGGQAAAGQHLHDPAGVGEGQVEAAGVARAGHPVEALGGQPVQVRGGHPLAGLDAHRGGREYLGGQPGGRGEDRRGPARAVRALRAVRAARAR